jgi:predicted ATPase
MVGREAELALVAQKLDQVLAGHGQIIGITAEAGMGKSRLVAEIIRLATDRQVTGYGGECQSYGTNISYLAWQPIWQGFFGLDSAWDVADQVRQVERHLELIDPGLKSRLPLLSAALNLPIPDNELTVPLTPSYAKLLWKALLLDCLRARAGKRLCS